MVNIPVPCSWSRSAIDLEQSCPVSTCCRMFSIITFKWNWTLLSSLCIFSTKWRILFPWTAPQRSKVISWRKYHKKLIPVHSLYIQLTYLLPIMPSSHVGQQQRMTRCLCLSWDIQLTEAQFGGKKNFNLMTFSIHCSLILPSELSCSGNYCKGSIFSDKLSIDASSGTQG